MSKDKKIDPCAGLFIFFIMLIVFGAGSGMPLGAVIQNVGDLAAGLAGLLMFGCFAFFLAFYVWEGVKLARAGKYKEASSFAGAFIGTVLIISAGLALTTDGLFVSWIMSII